uniref:ORF n=1 Tax=Salmonella enteritidis TaxID=149539 RepID=Q52101_SALEN|nr:ORF [Salmonella enterica subsp. enterica serovar Enteritidis]
MKKKNTTPTPHDATFRQFLTQPDIARDFMELHLPAELRAICDLSTLKLESGSFVEDDLRQYFSDVLYSLKTTAGDDIFMSWLNTSQHLTNICFPPDTLCVGAAMQRHLEAGHKKLPLVIPVLFYTGKRSPYPYSTRWLDEFDDTAPGRQTLQQRLSRLVDVTVIPDDEIAGHRSMAALTLLPENIFISGTWQNWLTGWRPFYGRISVFIAGNIAGTLYSAGRRNIRRRSLCTRTGTACAQHGDALMTIAQQLEQKGIEKGIQLGEQRGIEKGRSEGEREDSENSPYHAPERH